MINNEFTWFADWWEQAKSLLERRPSALLLVGPPHIGKTVFAQEIARALLCQNPKPDGSACGTCRSCNWMHSGLQHPDFRWIRPDAEAESEAAVAGESAEGKAASQEIRIEQVRGLAGFAHVGSHRGGLRVVLMSPANRMNYAAANALLKTLEEPPPALMFVLVADSLRGIPATVLSRCRRLDLSIPDADLARLLTANSQAAPWLLPLLESASVEPIKWAEKAGKSPPGEAIELLLRWMNDAGRVRAGLAPRSFPDRARALSEQAVRIRSDQGWSQAMAELQRLRAVAEHPLNPKLFYESIFDRLRRAQI